MGGASRLSRPATPGASTAPSCSNAAMASTTEARHWRAHLSSCRQDTKQASVSFADSDFLPDYLLSQEAPYGSHGVRVTRRALGGDLTNSAVGSAAARAATGCCSQRTQSPVCPDPGALGSHLGLLVALLSLPVPAVCLQVLSRRPLPHPQPPPPRAHAAHAASPRRCPALRRPTLSPALWGRMGVQSLCPMGKSSWIGNRKNCHFLSCQHSREMISIF